MGGRRACRDAAHPSGSKARDWECNDAAGPAALDAGPAAAAGSALGEQKGQRTHPAQSCMALARMKSVGQAAWTALNGRGFGLGLPVRGRERVGEGERSHTAPPGKAHGHSLSSPPVSLSHRKSSHTHSTLDTQPL